MSEEKMIWAFGGASIRAPKNTLPAYWGALGADADGLAFGVQLTSDGIAVCCDEPTLENTCGDPRRICEIKAEDLRFLDAGINFRSTKLDKENQPVGFGKDTPWEGVRKKQRPLYHPELSEVMLLFSRRTKLLLRLLPHDNSHKLVSQVVTLIERFGIAGSVIIAGNEDTLQCIRKLSSKTSLALIQEDETPEKAADTAAAMGLEYLILNAEYLASSKKSELKSLQKQLQATAVIAVSSSKSGTPTPENYLKLKSYAWIEGFIVRAVHEIRSLETPVACIVRDDFAGTEVNRTYWTMGYSKINQDTSIFQDDGLFIKIRQGGEYSGAAALTSFPIDGNFDAQVSFEVINPHQGTTFELAAIQVDPGYHHMSNEDLSKRSINLTFDVHGAPPYASSERDENDGFRIGWNNGPALPEFVDHIAQSSNIYNKYSRDVGDGSKSNPSGSLRLVRNGPVFNAYYRDKFNRQWVLSGTALVPTLCRTVFLRLGAKHWPKKGMTPPSNTIRFSKFRLYQPVINRYPQK
ncbi:glycerophosphodiester phosphodiesterase family protein [Lentisphaerota bacterium ZTH]|nr:hypothetical protein JYG24_01195 [Lentisphaerota bacterium]WET05252.1 glycerophosphodiester phosphodiesterase family protein [Lentisphaerota bacterium ZTH]